MRKQGIKRIICLIMACILLLSGMCFKLEETHSQFSYHSADVGQQIENMDKRVSCSEDSYPTYVSLENSSDASIADDDKNRAKSRVRILHVFCPEDSSPVFSVNLYVAVYEGFFCEAFTDTAIISYIHHSDGKK